MILDDGAPTPLNAKGDGVQSLAALALMRHMAESKSGKKHIVIAIEEPEAHLHPEATHAIHSVIRELSKNQQVVITTHNPIFVQREIIAANIIVQDGSAVPADSVADIRKSLGVRASDNLRHASLVLLVEGESDRRSVFALLSHCSHTLKQALSDGILVIDQMHGASNVVYKASQIQEALCGVHCFLDDDSSGRKAYKDLIDSAVMMSENITLTKVDGFPEAEFEDLLDPIIYKEPILAAFRVSLDGPKFKGNGKWSSRVKATFNASGKEWDKMVESRVKTLVAKCVEDNVDSAIQKFRSPLMSALVMELEQRLSETVFE